MLQTVNTFIYKRVLEQKMPNPNIPCYIHESYSQCYEDTILDGLIRAFLLRKGINEDQLAYLDIGANHPIANSNTYLLHIFHGICGILVDANPELIPALKKFRPYDKVINAAVTDTNEDFVTFYIGEKNELSSLDYDFLKAWDGLEPQKKVNVPTIRVMDLLRQLNDKHVLLSIDVEGFDRKILEDIDYSKIKPFVIVIEHNDHINQSESKFIIDLLSLNGYFLYSKTNVNLIFSIL
jgi:FkbM family methyltransferase